LNYTGKASLIHARDISNSDVVINIPANRFENKLQYERTTMGDLHDAFIGVSLVNVMKQHRQPQVIPISEIVGTTIDNVFDFVASPAAYALLNIEVGASLPIRDNSLNIILSVENVMNNRYNDYMNRMRYFTDDVGRNFSIRLKYNFHAHE
jgi:iron complex outermembrane receptor protein